MPPFRLRLFRLRMCREKSLPIHSLLTQNDSVVNSFCRKSRENSSIASQRQVDQRTIKREAQDIQKLTRRTTAAPRYQLGRQMNVVATEL